MAKIKQNNFLDTVDEVFTSAKNAGVLHLHAGGETFNGREIEINGKSHFHFGTTGYLGLEQDERLKNAAIAAVQQYGTQFPLSKSYISHPLYATLEERVETLFGHPIVITKNSTLGHMAVIPTIVRDEDAVILDHQVHWSVQNAAQLLKTRGIPVEMIRHNNLEMLEDRIKIMSSKSQKIWYMADGVYSMYGDYAPVKDLLELSKKYQQLHLYFDDVHGMSWKGEHGAGYVMDVLEELPENVLLFGTLSKTFGASGAVAVCSDKKLHSKIKTFGGPLTFSAQLEPASVGAAIAAASIHLTPEIYQLQKELQQRIGYFNFLLEKTDLPLIRKNDSPVFYIGTGMPISGYNFVRRLMNEGFYVNLGIYPAVPVKNTGVRITISRHNQGKEIKDLVEAMVYHLPLALAETNSSLSRVKRAFKMPVAPGDEAVVNSANKLQLQYETTIQRISRTTWNGLFGGEGVFDWDGQDFLENVFANNDREEDNWSFHYFIIRDIENKPVLATFFSYALWKDDLLASASVSLMLEKKRKKDPYYLTSYVFSTGSLFTEGNHLYLDRSHPNCLAALNLLFQKVEELDSRFDASLIVLRDFVEDEELNKIFHQRGFIKTEMPESSKLEGLTDDLGKYRDSLSSRSRKHLRKDILAFEDKFEIEIKSSITDQEVDHFYRLYENVKLNNPGLNTFSFPKKLFKEMSSFSQWEFLVIRLKKPYNERQDPEPVGVMFCYKNQETFVPSFIGMDYDFAREYQVYRQLLYQTVRRAINLGCTRIDFGMTAAFEKKKLGAKVERKFSYVQAKDNFSMELIGTLQNEQNK